MDRAECGRTWGGRKAADRVEDVGTWGGSDVCGKCIVIGAGDLTVGEISAGEEDMVIAVDGGLSYCGILNLEPELIIGDFDSVSAGDLDALETLKKRIPDRIISLPQEKDDTDMLAALKEGLSRGYTDFRIYAGMGGRFDHTFANIQCLLYLKNRGASGYLMDGAGMMLVIADESVRFQKGLRGYLSLFSMVKESKGVSIRNMKYTLQKATVSNEYPIGISNEFIGEEAEIIVEDGALMCMISWEEDSAERISGPAGYNG